MDWKSIVLNKRMKFFFNITLISNCLSLSWAYLYDALDILEPSHRLSYQYSTHHNQLPKSADPNIVCSTWGILFEEAEKSGLSFSLPKYLYSKMVDTQRTYEYGPCSQLLSKYVHFLNYKSAPTNHDNDVEYLLVKQDNDILLPILNGNLNYLSNENSFGSLTYNKSKTFIETKVTAIKLQGFNL